MTQQTTLVLLRHGETFWNALDKAQGHQDIALNEKGLLQAQEVAKHLKQKHPELAFIYSSDLIRAYQTAEALSQIFSLPISKTPQLREVSFGEAEGLTAPEIAHRYGDKKKELDEKYPERKDRWKIAEIPGAETLSTALLRFTSCLQTIGKAHPGQTCAVVTHGKLLKLLLAEMQNLDDVPSIPNCSLVPITYCLVSDSLICK
ncbi:MAG: histidine phosphatase family protein [Rhabdochlamydiaceae bacterium]|nr:histidine phosphatase family protein [Rhabdochlamydiaceae bacterium]